MKKIDQKAEKAERNKIYALKFKKKEKEKKGKREVSRFANWCRTEGHDPSCSCAYPSREEVIEASRRK